MDHSSRRPWYAFSLSCYAMDWLVILQSCGWPLRVWLESISARSRLRPRREQNWRTSRNLPRQRAVAGDTDP